MRQDAISKEPRQAVDLHRSGPPSGMLCQTGHFVEHRAETEEVRAGARLPFAQGTVRLMAAEESMPNSTENYNRMAGRARIGLGWEDHSMSLKEADWKAVLNQPKNLGLKAGGGTGIGAALIKVERSERMFHDHKTEANGQELSKTLVTTRPTRALPKSTP